MMVLQALLFAAVLQDGGAAGRVEARYREYREKLIRYSAALRSAVAREAPELLHLLEAEPIEPVRHGYQLLPALIPAGDADAAEPLQRRRYSWPITEGYVRAEETRIAAARAVLLEAETASDSVRRGQLLSLAQQYRQLIGHQETIDQYVQYNRFWQSAIREDPARYDLMTRVHVAVQERDRLRKALQEAPDAGRDVAVVRLEELEVRIREALPPPELPAFVQVLRQQPGQAILRVPVYTDIEDSSFLARAERVIEETWRFRDDEHTWAVDVEFRRRTAADLYGGEPPRRGGPIDVAAHVARFPADGGVFTTGAMSVFSYAGRHIAVGPAPLPERVLAHEFGHLLGFRDGYYRSYTDLGDEGFEIQEFVPDFDDIMSAPRHGRVHAFHFQALFGPR